MRRDNRRVIVLWQAFYGSYRLLARRVGRPAASAAIIATTALLGLWLLVSPRSILAVIALILLGFVWLWAPAYRLGSWSRWVTLTVACLAALAVGSYVLGR